ncbi:hypothetical protein EYF80_031575 [Liparis tanakae]|uniref:Uncharacterized protein n=1 Tax=Liparis tanakae TaxID=230148 RepID=A0A4Z2GYN8_9TELE|nr:hypothetical protein EYF80_031575 [Liparis tanakae]
MLVSRKLGLATKAVVPDHVYLQGCYGVRHSHMSVEEGMGCESALDPRDEAARLGKASAPRASFTSLRPASPHTATIGVSAGLASGGNGSR